MYSNGDRTDLPESMQPPDPPQRPGSVQRLLLYLLLRGATVASAARQLDISPRTAGTLLADLRESTGTSNLYALGAEAERRGWHRWPTHSVAVRMDTSG
jgi:DNA-binding CsgD family transcriptional regulator